MPTEFQSGSLFQRLVVLGLQEARGYSHSWADQRQSGKKCMIFPLPASYMGGHPGSAYTSLAIAVSSGVRWGHIPPQEK